MISNIYNTIVPTTKYNSNLERGLMGAYRRRMKSNGRKYFYRKPRRQTLMGEIYYGLEPLSPADEAAAQAEHLPQPTTTPTTTALPAKPTTALPSPEPEADAGLDPYRAGPSNLNIPIPSSTDQAAAALKNALEARDPDLVMTSEFDSATATPVVSPQQPSTYTTPIVSAQPSGTTYRPNYAQRVAQLQTEYPRDEWMNRRKRYLESIGHGEISMDTIFREYKELLHNVASGGDLSLEVPSPGDAESSIDLGEWLGFQNPQGPPPSSNPTSSPGTPDFPSPSSGSSYQPSSTPSSDSSAETVTRGKMSNIRAVGTDAMSGLMNAGSSVGARLPGRRQLGDVARSFSRTAYSQFPERETVANAAGTAGSLGGQAIGTVAGGMGAVGNAIYNQIPEVQTVKDAAVTAGSLGGQALGTVAGGIKTVGGAVGSAIYNQLPDVQTVKDAAGSAAGGAANIIKQIASSSGRPNLNDRRSLHKPPPIQTSRAAPPPAAAPPPKADSPPAPRSKLSRAAKPTQSMADRINSASSEELDDVDFNGQRLTTQDLRRDAGNQIIRDMSRYARDSEGKLLRTAKGELKLKGGRRK